MNLAPRCSKRGRRSSSAPIRPTPSLAGRGRRGGDEARCLPVAFLWGRSRDRPLAFRGPGARRCDTGDLRPLVVAAARGVWASARCCSVGSRRSSRFSLRLTMQRSAPGRGRLTPRGAGAGARFSRCPARPDASPRGAVPRGDRRPLARRAPRRRPETRVRHGRWIRRPPRSARARGAACGQASRLLEHPDRGGWTRKLARGSTSPTSTAARAGTVEALVLNRRGGMSPELRDRYARAGLVHILSISGFHVGVIVGWVVLLGGCRACRATELPCSPPGVAFVYVFFLGWPPPAARAALLAGLAAQFHLRQRNPQAISLLARHRPPGGARRSVGSAGCRGVAVGRALSGALICFPVERSRARDGVGIPYPIGFGGCHVGHGPNHRDACSGWSRSRESCSTL